MNLKTFRMFRRYRDLEAPMYPNLFYTIHHSAAL